MSQFFRLTEDIDVSVLPLHWKEGDARCYHPIPTSGAVREWDFELPVSEGVKILLRYTRRGQSAPLYLWWQPLSQEDAAADLPGEQDKWNNEFTLDYNKPFLLVEPLCLQSDADIDILRLKSATNEVLLTMKFHIHGYKAPKPGDASILPNQHEQEDHSDWLQSDKKGLHALLRQLRHRI